MRSQKTRVWPGERRTFIKEELWDTAPSGTKGSTQSLLQQFNVNHI